MSSLPTSRQDVDRAKVERVTSRIGNGTYDRLDTTDHIADGMARHYGRTILEPRGPRKLILKEWVDNEMFTRLVAAHCCRVDDSDRPFGDSPRWVHVFNCQVDVTACMDESFENRLLPLGGTITLDDEAAGSVSVAVEFVSYEWQDDRMVATYDVEAV